MWLGRGSKYRRLFVVLCLILLIATPILVFFWFAESSSLSWDIEVGDEFRYEVSYAEFDTVDTHQWETDPNGHEHWRMPDNATLLVTISSLPDIPAPLTGDTFLNEIVKSQKAEVTLANGSALPDYMGEEVTDSISSLFLPTGGWELLDLFFPDSGLSEYNLGTEGEEYHSKVLSTEIFIFEFLHYVWYAHGGGAHPGGTGGGWRGHITMSRGVPDQILVLDAAPDYFGQIYVWAMNLTRVY